jgi:hypothetical protein
MSRAVFSSEDFKRIIDGIFNGNRALSRKNPAKYPYANPNSEIITVEQEGQKQDVDLAQWLNVDFYVWKNRIVQTEKGREDFDAFAAQFARSLNYSACLCELSDPQVVMSQDIDGATQPVQLTFIAQTNKVPVLERYIDMLRNKYLASPETIQASNGADLTAFVTFGRLLSNGDPAETPLGECQLVSVLCTINYMTEASAYNSVRISFSLTDEGGEWYRVPLTNATMQAMLSGDPIPQYARPDVTAMRHSAHTRALGVAFFDFNQEFNLALDDWFYSLGSYKRDGEATPALSPNKVIFCRMEANGHAYIYRFVCDGMTKKFEQGAWTVTTLNLRSAALTVG